MQCMAAFLLALAVLAPPEFADTSVHAGVASAQSTVRGLRLSVTTPK